MCTSCDVRCIFYVSNRNMIMGLLDLTQGRYAFLTTVESGIGCAETHLLEQVHETDWCYGIGGNQ
jgi:hypothetical protein